MASLFVKKHTAFQTILLHLVPGLLNLFAIILLKQITTRSGSAESGYFLAGQFMIIIAMFPIQIGFLLFIAKRTTKTYNILTLMPYLEKSRTVEYIIFTIIMIGWALGVSAVLTPVEHGLRDSLFAFIPDSFAFRNVDYSVVSKDMLIFMACLTIFTNGFVAPITEELYFRGYLLPRINLSPIMAVITNAVLFSLYHFFSPWYFFSRILMMIPLYYWVMKRKNIRFSIMAHIIANVLTGVSFLLEVIRL